MVVGSSNVFCMSCVFKVEDDNGYREFRLTKNILIEIYV